MNIYISSYIHFVILFDRVSDMIQQRWIRGKIKHISIKFPHHLLCFITFGCRDNNTRYEYCNIFRHIFISSFYLIAFSICCISTECMEKSIKYQLNFPIIFSTWSLLVVEIIIHGMILHRWYDIAYICSFSTSSNTDIVTYYALCDKLQIIWNIWFNQRLHNRIIAYEDRV